MSKKRQREEAQRLDALLESLLPDLEQLSQADVDRLVVESGCDLPATRRQLRTTANEISASYRRKGQPAPRALTAFADAMDDSSKLPQNAAAALAKAARLVEALGNKLMPPLEGLRIIEAYRMSDRELSERDREVLDNASAELRRELDSKREE
jgi:hypothetical protein